MEEQDNVSIVNLIDDNKKPKYKGVIGTLKGIFADMNHPTRNGRQYDKRCWQQALNSDDVKEKLETRTMFGELDHPADRLETLQERAAIITTKLEMNDKDGVIMGEADILDTPFGRILKTFIDAGVKVGISSRGAGEEVMSEGMNKIVPETFYLETFDIVSMPAVKSARLSLVESKNRNIITEAFAKEISTAKSSEVVDELLNYAKSRNVSNIVKLEEAANNVKNSFGENNILPEDEEGDNIDVSSDVISQLEEELNVSNTKYNSLQGLCEKMKKHSVNVVKQLSEAKTVNDLLTKQVEDYIRKTDDNITMLESYKDSNKILKTKLNESTQKVNSLTEEVNNKTSEVELIKKEAKNFSDKLVKKYENKIISLKDENNSLLEEVNNSKKLLAKRILDLRESNNKLKEFEETNSKYKLENENLTKQLEESKNSSLLEANENKENINSLTKQLSEAKELIESLQNKLSLKEKENTNLIKESKTVKESYLNKVAESNNIDKLELKKSLNENYSIKDIDNKVNMILENNKNIDKLPFNVRSSILNEGLSISIKDDSNNEDSNNNTLNKMANKVKSFK